MQTILQWLGLEPVGVEGHHVGCLVLFIVAREVLLQPLQDLLLIQIVQDTLIEVGAMTALISLHIVGVQGHLPYAGEGARGAGTALALVGDLVVEGVGPDGNGNWGHGDGAVVDVAKVLKDLSRRGIIILLI